MSTKVLLYILLRNWLLLYMRAIKTSASAFGKWLKMDPTCIVSKLSELFTYIDVYYIYSLCIMHSYYTYHILIILKIYSIYVINNCTFVKIHMKYMGSRQVISWNSILEIIVFNHVPLARSTCTLGPLHRFL